MALLDREPAPKYESRTGCGLGRLIESMSEDDQLTINIWLQKRPDLSNRAIADALKAEYPGWMGSGPMVQRHRAQTCGCKRDDEPS